MSKQSRKAGLPGPNISKPSASTDWLAALIVTAKTTASASEIVPFPLIKGVFGSVVTLLEVIEVSIHIRISVNGNTNSPPAYA